MAPGPASHPPPSSVSSPAPRLPPPLTTPVEASPWPARPAGSRPVPSWRGCEGAGPHRRPHPRRGGCEFPGGGKKRGQIASSPLPTRLPPPPLCPPPWLSRGVLGGRAGGCKKLQLPALPRSWIPGSISLPSSGPGAGSGSSTLSPATLRACLQAAGSPPASSSCCCSFHTNFLAPSLCVGRGVCRMLLYCPASLLCCRFPPAPPPFPFSLSAAPAAAQHRSPSAPLPSPPCADQTLCEPWARTTLPWYPHPVALTVAPCVMSSTAARRGWSGAQVSCPLQLVGASPEDSGPLVF